MKFKKFAPIFLALGLSAAANAAMIPLKLPTVNGYAVTMPGLSILPMSMPGATYVMAEIAVPTLNALSYPVSAPMSLPARPVPVPVIGRTSLPGVPSPLPLPLPMVTAEVAVPKPITPATAFNALNEMRDSMQGREPIRVTGAEVFDGRRETKRDVALPADKFF
jgi:hypothetical protein